MAQTETFIVRVDHLVEVTLDPSKFDAAFMSEFNKTFFRLDSPAEHAEHLASLYAQGMDMRPASFVEGYGPLHEMGITARTIGASAECEPDLTVSARLAKQGGK
jgi:hypothetical protein